MWTVEFWKALTERAVKTGAQTAAATLVATGTGLIGTDWIGVASITAMAIIVSALTSIGSGIVTREGPSLGGMETLAEPRHTSG